MLEVLITLVGANTVLTSLLGFLSEGKENSPQALLASVNAV
jgi:hypothetical protein